MIKIIDIDKLFDEYISDYVYSNIGKIKPEEIEDKMPVLYNEFGDKKLKELDGFTPNEYYKHFNADELLECLKNHLEQKVSVSDFLCEALEGNDTENEIVAELNKENGEEYTLYLMNILNVKKSVKGLGRYLEFILYDYSTSLKELATELLCENSEKVKEKILSEFSDSEENVKPYLTEILAHTKRGDDRVFNILIEEFVKNTDKIPQYAYYLSKYGDERALPFLETLIESDKIDYGDFEELRFAIESLGGEYKNKRDFSSDKVYKKIKLANKKEEEE